MSDGSTPVPFTVWNPPSSSFPIRCPLSLFRDIDFFVGGGYLRIPHGGLEVGAVMYGHGEPSGVTILAYREIACQHSMGPSFKLSTLDLDQLGKQLATPFRTEEGEALEVVGWLISHSRSDLVLTEMEAQIYDEYFPLPRQVTLLAKPERMKPTRYSFLERPPRGRLIERVCEYSFILPLSTKGEATPIPEVSAKAAAQPAAAKGISEPRPGRVVDPRTPTPSVIEAAEPEPVSAPKAGATDGVNDGTAPALEREPAGAPAPDSATPRQTAHVAAVSDPTPVTAGAPEPVEELTAPDVVPALDSPVEPAPVSRTEFAPADPVRDVAPPVVEPEPAEITAPESTTSVETALVAAGPDPTPVAAAAESVASDPVHEAVLETGGEQALAPGPPASIVETDTTAVGSDVTSAEPADAGAATVSLEQPLARAGADRAAAEMLQPPVPSPVASQVEPAAVRPEGEAGLSKAEISKSAEISRTAKTSAAPEKGNVRAAETVPLPESVAASTRQSTPQASGLPKLPGRSPMVEPIPERQADPEKLFSTGRSAVQPELEDEATPESKYTRPSRMSKAEVALCLAILLLLGFAAAWMYVRLQATPIPLNAEIHGGEVVVTWRPEFTANARQSSITTWTNGQPSVRLLLEDEQTEGKVTVETSAPDVVIQLHAPTWYREGTGQIRVVRIVPPPPPAAPAIRRRPTRRFAPLPANPYGSPPLVGRPADPAPHSAPH